MPDLWIAFRELFTEHPLFLVGLLLLVGYSVGKLAVRVRLPEISGFILAGLFFGFLVTDVDRIEMNRSLHIVTEVAIGFLALTIGGEFSARKMRRIGKDVLTITFVHVVGTFLLVLAGCIAFNALVPQLHIGYPYAILLAVIACATSPAIIVAEVHHMRAHGKFIDYLFGVIAFGDAITVVVFGLAFTIVTNILGASDSYALVQGSVLEILYSFLIGGASAVPLSMLTRRVRNPNELMIITVGFIFALTGVSVALHLSPLLVNMALGAALINLSSNHQRVFRSIEPFTPPIYALFFIIAGLEIDPGVFLSRVTLLAGGIYILLRAGAKCWTAAVGCRIRGVKEPIGRYLGMCMLSKGGVALGFVLLIQTSPAVEALRGDPEIIRILTALVNVVLLSIFVNELISPLFLRHAVLRGNEMEEA